MTFLTIWVPVTCSAQSPLMRSQESCHLVTFDRGVLAAQVPCLHILLGISLQPLQSCQILAAHCWAMELALWSIQRRTMMQAILNLFLLHVGG